MRAPYYGRAVKGTDKMERLIAGIDLDAISYQEAVNLFYYLTGKFRAKKEEAIEISARHMENADIFMNSGDNEESDKCFEEAMKYGVFASVLTGAETFMREVGNRVGLTEDEMK